MTSTTHERTGKGRSSRPRSTSVGLTYLLAMLAPLSVAAPLATWGATSAAAAAKAAPNAAAVWFVALRRRARRSVRHHQGDGLRAH